MKGLKVIGQSEEPEEQLRPVVDLDLLRLSPPGHHVTKTPADWIRLVPGAGQLRINQKMSHDHRQDHPGPPGSEDFFFM